jgi:hypothetical protein
MYFLFQSIHVHAQVARLQAHNPLLEVKLSALRDILVRVEVEHALKRRLGICMAFNELNSDNQYKRSSKAISIRVGRE